MIVLDTNVVSELMKSAPNEAVRRWVGNHPATSLFTTTVTQAEILLGIELMPKGKRRADLLAAAEIMFGALFDGRTLPFDGDAARAMAQIGARRRRQGRPIGDCDLQIAGIAASRSAAVATRDTSGFADCGIDVVDPWAGK
jgi:predicted nucleic acid-binding protein